MKFGTGIRRLLVLCLISLLCFACVRRIQKTPTTPISPRRTASPEVPAITPVVTPGIKPTAAPSLEIDIRSVFLPVIAREGRFVGFSQQSVKTNLYLPLIARSLAGKSDLNSALKLLGEYFAGKSLSDAYLAADGMTEQIFENVILAVDTQSGADYILRPLTTILEIKPDPLEPESNDPEMIFFPVDGEMGYNVPIIFLHYLNLHGGVDHSGQPINRYREFAEGVFGQCFENYCLEEHRDTADGLIIRPAKMGLQYKEKHSPVASTPETDDEQNLVSLQFWHKYPKLSSSQSQEITVSVFQDSHPMLNIEPEVIVNLPDGLEKRYNLPPTDSNGNTLITLPPIDAPSGTKIPYQVCIYQETDFFCIRDSFLIWNIP